MNGYRVSEQAKLDLAEIWHYIAEDNSDAAGNLIDVLFSKFPLLASNPEIGRRRDEILRGVRSLPVGNYVIFYRPEKDGIEVVRVVHGARDLPPLFE